MVMLAMAGRHAAHQPGLALLTPRDIVKMLQETLPRRPEGKDALGHGSTRDTNADAAPSHPASVLSARRRPRD